MGSFIQASRKGDRAKNAYKKQQELQKGKSGMYKKDNKKFGGKMAALPTIQEETTYKKNVPEKKPEKIPEKKPVDIQNDSGELMAQSGSSNADQPLTGLKNQPKGFGDSPDKFKEEKPEETEFTLAKKGTVDKTKFKTKK